MNRFKLPERSFLRCAIFREFSSDHKILARCYSENGLTVVKKGSRGALARELQRAHYHLNRYLDIRRKNTSAAIRDADKPWDVETLKQSVADPKNHYTINIYYNTPAKKSNDSSAAMFNKPDKKDTERKLRATIEQYLLHRMLQDKTFLESSLKKFLKNDLKNVTPAKMNIIRDYIKSRHDEYLISALNKLQEIQESKAASGEQRALPEALTEEMESVSQEQLEEPNTTLAVRRVESKPEVGSNANSQPPPWFQLHHSPVKAAEEIATKEEEVEVPEVTTNTVKRPDWANFADLEEEVANPPDVLKPQPVVSRYRPEVGGTKRKQVWSDYDQGKANQGGAHTVSYKEEEFEDEDNISVDNQEAEAVTPRKVAMSDDEMQSLFYSGVPESERKEMVAHPGAQKYSNSSRKKDMLHNSTTIPQFDEQKRGLSDDEMAAIYTAYSVGPQLYYPGGITVNRRRKLRLTQEVISEEVTASVKKEEDAMRTVQDMVEQESNATERVLSEQYNEASQEAHKAKEEEYKGDPIEPIDHQRRNLFPRERMELQDPETAIEPIEGQLANTYPRRRQDVVEECRDTETQEPIELQLRNTSARGSLHHEETQDGPRRRQDVPEGYRERETQEPIELQLRNTSQGRSLQHEETQDDMKPRRRQDVPEGYRDTEAQELQLRNTSPQHEESQHDIDPIIKGHLNTPHTRKRQDVQEENADELGPVQRQARKPRKGRRRHDLREHKGTQGAIEQQLGSNYSRRRQHLQCSVADPQVLGIPQKHVHPLVYINSEILEIDDDICLTPERTDTPKYVHFQHSQFQTDLARVSMEEEPPARADGGKPTMGNVQMADNDVIVSTPSGNKRRIANAKCSTGSKEDTALTQYLVSLALNGSPRKFSNESTFRPPESPSSDIQKVDADDLLKPEKSYIENLRELSVKALARMNEALFPDRLVATDDANIKVVQLCLPSPDEVQGYTGTTVAKIAGDMDKAGDMDDEIAGDMERAADMDGADDHVTDAGSEEDASPKSSS